MKKLMIAALVAAMGGVVVAADCGEPLTCPFVYRVKLAGKTVSAAATGRQSIRKNAASRATAKTER